MNARLKLIGIIPLTCLLLVLFRWVVSDPPRYNQAQKDHFWTYKTHHKKKYNLVVAGDSRIHRGLPIAPIEQAIPSISGFNFGYKIAGYTPEYLALIESHIDLEAEATFLVLGVSPASLLPRTIEHQHFFRFQNQPWVQTWKSMYLSQYLQTFSPYKWSEVQGQITGRDQETFLRQVFHSDGWIETEKSPAKPNMSLKSYAKLFLKQSQVSEQAESYLIGKVEEWTAQGIKVIAFRPPTTDKMVALEDSLSGFSQAQFQADFEANGGTWLEISNAGYNTYDGSHLQFESALKLSHRIRDELKLRLTVPTAE